MVHGVVFLNFWAVTPLIMFCIFYIQTFKIEMYFTYKGFPHSSVSKESACNCRRPWFNSWVRNICWRRDRPLTPVFLGFPCGSAGKKSTCNVGDQGLIPGLGRLPGEGTAYPLQYAGLENSMDCIVHGVAKSQTLLSDFHLTIFLVALHKFKVHDTLF